KNVLRGDEGWTYAPKTYRCEARVLRANGLTQICGLRREAQQTRGIGWETVTPILSVSTSSFSRIEGLPNPFSQCFGDRSIPNTYPNTYFISFYSRRAHLHISHNQRTLYISRVEVKAKKIKLSSGGKHEARNSN
ncbi:MAG: hypothetical protein QW290_09560, partial [Sulfolobales archaeon]